VHSFEPQPQLAAQLRTWVPDNVTVHEAAVSAQSGTATLTRPDAMPGTDGLATLREGQAGEQVSVEAKAIDDCGLENIGFMKIDVEGLELEALNGAEATIDRDRPRLMIEIEQRHIDHPIGDVFDWLAQRGYEGWFLRGTKTEWFPLTEFDVDRDQTAHAERPKSASYVNAFLFTPVEEGWSSGGSSAR
jgi:FkbM family methyltransferase